MSKTDSNQSTENRDEQIARIRAAFAQDPEYLEGKRREVVATLTHLQVDENATVLLSAGWQGGGDAYRLADHPAHAAALSTRMRRAATSEELDALETRMRARLDVARIFGEA